jgi:hypothetical protein
MPEFTDWISGESDPEISPEEIEIIAGALAPSLADIIDAAGVLPVGGTADQVLAKIDGTDFNTEWVDQSGGGGAVDSVNTQTGAVVLDADDISDELTDNKFVSATEVAKLATIQTGATAGPAVRYATQAGTVTNADIVVVGQGPASSQTVEIQYVPHDAARTLLATITITTTAGIFASPAFSQALRVVTDGNGSITDADGIAVVITAGPVLPPPLVTFR